MENLELYQGYYFTAKIEGKQCEGRIQVRGGTIFLCQNSKNGDKCINRFGYKYSWNVLSGTSDDFKRNNVTDFKLIDEVIWWW